MAHRPGAKRPTDSASGPYRGARGAGDVPRWNRRQALAFGGAVGIGALAGCLDAVVGDGTREEVSPEAPDGSPDGTPAEFYYALERTGIDVEELYVDIEDDDLILFYASTADDRDESDEEIREIYETFRNDLVEPGTDVEHLYTEVSGGYDDQVEGWGVNAEWAEDELAETASTADVLYAIETTKVYPDGEGPAETDDGPIEIPAEEDVIELESEPTINETGDVS